MVFPRISWRLAKKKKVQGFRCTLRRCWASLGSWVVWSWLLRFPWTQYWFLLLVGSRNNSLCRKEILLNQLHFKDGFFPSDLPKRKRTAGLRLKEDFSKKRISRLWHLKWRKLCFASQTASKCNISGHQQSWVKIDRLELIYTWGGVSRLGTLPLNALQILFFYINPHEFWDFCSTANAILTLLLAVMNFSESMKTCSRDH